MRIIVAPMAGGPSTPALVRAAAEAGAFGFLATGALSAAQADAEMSACAGVRYGVNLFARQEPLASLTEVRAVAGELGVEVPAVDYSNCWEEKFAAVLRHRPAVASSTFGPFSAGEIAQLHDRGIEAWITVTNPVDAVTADALGADALVVQGPEAGGHRATWTVGEEPDARLLPELLDACRAVSDLPLIAAGGIRTPADVRALRADAVACGSAFLLAEEAGTSPANRELLRGGGETVSTRAFSGRYARGLPNGHSGEHAIYPYLRPMMKQIGAPYCLVGSGVDKLRAGTAAEILDWLGN